MDRYYAVSLTLLLCVAVSSSATDRTCVPVAGGNPWVQVKDMPAGCWSSFLQDGKEEVHILSITFSPHVV
ncbi:hypothetical protein NHX12_027036, partial [Muraenolepis orangiensis]